MAPEFYVGESLDYFVYLIYIFIVYLVFLKVSILSDVHF